MIRRPPISTRTDTLFPYTTLFRSPPCLSRHAIRRESLLSSLVCRPPWLLGPGPVRLHLRRAANRSQLNHMYELYDSNCGKARRSEEHTSELQSLMRISYAVFCLKKNNNSI